MNETDFGYNFDISYNPDTNTDVILIDTEDGSFYLTAEDLKIMIGMLEDE